jgi:hypothetical protein
MSKRLKSLALGAGLVALGLPLLAASPPDAAERQVLDAARDALSRWVETKQLISRERQDWQLGREVLGQRVRLVQGEIDTLEEKIAQSREGIAEAETKRRELLEENRSLEQATDELLAAVRKMEGQLKQTVTRLPDPIRERVAPLSERLPDDPETTELSLGQRYQNVIGVLNEINKFNRELTLSSEVRSLPGGKTAEVKTLYIGLGQGYYVTPNGDAAGVGRPGGDGRWEWTAADELAPEITRAIRILQNEEVPAYVPLPAVIR